MIKLVNKFCLIIILCVNSFNVFSQSVAEGLSEESVVSGRDDLFTEKILKIAPTKKIFILSNDNGNLKKGDFFSILIGEELAARALTAKNKNSVVGIKVTKIYSMKMWTQLSRGLNIQILKGDDTFFRKSSEKAADKDNPEIGSVESIDDLYNDTVLDSGGDIDEDGKRAIKTDNVLSGAFSTIAAEDVDGNDVSFPMWWISWSYQLADNFWGEFQYGQTNLADYPYGGLDTKLQTMNFRLKYTIKGPYYSFILPYVGYRIQSADSADAGKASSDDNTSDTTVIARLDREVELVEELNQRSITFGVTLLKRLVPGWFLKGEIGTDGYNVGIALEF